MTYLGERLRRARVEADLTQEELAERIGVAPLTVGRYERGSQAPRPGHLKAIADATGRSVSWLYENQPAPPGPLRVRRGRRRGTTPHPRPTVPARQARSVAVPLFQSVPAGNLKEAQQHSEELVAIPESWVRGRAIVYCLRIEGNSMEPELRDGDIIAVRRQESADAGAIVVASVEGSAEAGGYTVKRLQIVNGRARLRSENRALPDPSPEQPLRIDGKVIGLIREL